MLTVPPCQLKWISNMQSSMPSIKGFQVIKCWIMEWMDCNDFKNGKPKVWRKTSSVWKLPLLMAFLWVELGVSSSSFSFFYKSNVTFKQVSFINCTYHEFCVDIHVDLMFVVSWLWVTWLGGSNTRKKIIHYLDMACLGS